MLVGQTGNLFPSQPLSCIFFEGFAVSSSHKGDHAVLFPQATAVSLSWSPTREQHYFTPILSLPFLESLTAPPPKTPRVASGHLWNACCTHCHLSLVTRWDTPNYFPTIRSNSVHCGHAVKMYVENSLCVTTPQWVRDFRFLTMYNTKRQVQEVVSNSSGWRVAQVS